MTSSVTKGGEGLDPKSGRPWGDHGEAVQAIRWALDHNPEGDCMAADFLRDWESGDLEQWPEFYAWLSAQDPTQ